MRFPEILLMRMGQVDFTYCYGKDALFSGMTEVLYQIRFIESMS
jgi:hypothetical protein